MKKLSIIGTALFAGFMAAAWLALLLADIGCFRAWPCIAVAAGAAPAAGLFNRRAARAESEDDASPGCLVMTLLLAAGFLGFALPPSEVILGGWDPGVYLHTASTVAKSGSLRFGDVDMAVLSDLEKQVVSRDLFGVPEPFGGMRVLPDGRTSPEFHHLFPSLLAIAWSLGGIHAALCVNAVLSAAGIVLLFLLASCWVGRGCAVFAALLLAVNPAQVWQAGFPTAEPLTQCLLLGGFLFLPRALAGRSALDAVLAGAAFALALLARYDTILVLVPLAAVLVVTWQPSASRRNMIVFGAVFAAGMVHLYLRQKYVAPYYTPLSDLVGRGLLVAGVLLAAWLVLSRLPGVRLAERLRRCDVEVSAALGVCFVAWFLFAWFIRTRLGVPGPITSIVKSVLAACGASGWMDALVGPDARNMLVLAGLLGRIGLALALGGVAAMIWRAREPWQKAWLYPSVFVLVVLVTRVFNDHFLMWVSRRYVPVVLPLLCVGAAFGAKAVFHAGSRRNVFLAMGVSLALMVATATLGIPSLRPIIAIRDWSGLIAWYEQVHPAIPDDAIVYSDQPGFAAPLRYLYGKHAFELQIKTDDRRARLAELMAVRIAAGADVWFLTMDGPIQSPALSFEPIRAIPLHTQILDRRRLSVPTDMKPRGGDFVLYRVHVRP
ncbi:MAG: glycosyltransferase family 39 protein [bacterium]